MKEYKRKKKNNEYHSEKLARQGKQNIHMREYNRRKKDIETETENETDQNIFNCIVEKEKYLALFDSQTNGPIHLQEWAKKICGISIIL